MAETAYNATLIRRLEITPGLLILRVKPDGELFDFAPGQYTVLGLKAEAVRAPHSEPDDLAAQDPDKLIQRAYSIASSSVRKDYLEFYINLVASGELTPRLFALKEGDRLRLGTKATGLFTLDRIPAGKHVLLVATGTGLAPYMSMLRTQLDCAGGRKFIVVHGASYSWDLGYRDELETWARDCPATFYYLPAVSRPGADPSWNGLKGRLQPVIAGGAVERATGLALAPDVLDIFLCGHPEMIKAMTQFFQQKGFTPDQRKQVGTIHQEVYW